jgi:hypothetical protein
MRQVGCRIAGHPGGYSSFITATMLMRLYKPKERCHRHDVLEMHGLSYPSPHSGWVPPVGSLCHYFISIRGSAAHDCLALGLEAVQCRIKLTAAKRSHEPGLHQSASCPTWHPD